MVGAETRQLAGQNYYEVKINKNVLFHASQRKRMASTIRQLVGLAIALFVLWLIWSGILQAAIDFVILNPLFSLVIIFLIIIAFNALRKRFR